MRNLKSTLIFSIILLSGCSTYGSFVDSVSSTFDDTVNVFVPSSGSSSCEERTTRQLTNVSFDNAASIEMVIRHGEYSPMIVRMRVGQTYVLRLRNRDQETHGFVAPEFFDSIAIDAAALDNDILETRCPGPSIRLAAGQSFEMKILAVVDGRYEFSNDVGSLLNMGGLLSRSPTGGIINIQEQY